MEYMKNNKVLIISLTVLVVLALGSVCGYYYLKSREVAPTGTEQDVVKEIVPQVVTEGTEVPATTEVGTTESPVPLGVPAPVGLPPAPAPQQ